MTLEDYSRNLKGVNDKADFAPEYIVRSLWFLRACCCFTR